MYQSEVFLLNIVASHSCTIGILLSDGLQNLKLSQSFKLMINFIILYKLWKSLAPYVVMI